MSTSESSREVPAKVYELPLGERIRWARKTAGLSHDRLVDRLGRSNRGHLIQLERGTHSPRQDMRDAIADATGVPRDLFDDGTEVGFRADTFRGVGADDDRGRAPAVGKAGGADTDGVTGEAAA